MEPCNKSQTYLDESDISQINTANSSPLMAGGQKGIKNLRSSRTSKFAKQMRETAISNFNNDQENDDTFEYRFVQRSRHAIVEPTKSENVSVNFLMPQELLASDVSPLPNQILKSGFLIEAINIKYQDLNDLTISGLIIKSIESINTLLFKRRVAFTFSQDTSKYSLRASKKSGLPDFDFPGKYLKN